VAEEERNEEKKEEVPEEGQEEAPFKTYATKEEHDAYLESALKDRLARKDRKLQEEKAEAERAAREKALKDQEDWKRLYEESTETIEDKNQRITELEAVEGERDSLKELAESREKLLAKIIKPQLEVVPELYRPFLADMPVEKQAEWLEKNAEKLGASGANGGGKPAGSRPTGRPASPPRAEADKEAREAQRLARVSNI
jgi:hypothetical protein